MRPVGELGMPYQCNRLFFGAVQGIKAININVHVNVVRRWRNRLNQP